MSHQVHVDTLHQILCHHRRRCILDYLADQNSPIAVDDLAEEVAHREQNASKAMPSDDVQTVQIALFHKHLPKLADAGLVDYDPDRSTVRYSNHPGVDELLDSHADLDGVRAD